MVYTGRPWTHVKSKIKKEYPTVQYAAWTFWPVIGWINHHHVPLQFRVIVQSFVSNVLGYIVESKSKISDIDQMLSSMKGTSQIISIAYVRIGSYFSSNIIRGIIFVLFLIFYPNMKKQQDAFPFHYLAS